MKLVWENQSNGAIAEVPHIGKLSIFRAGMRFRVTVFSESQIQTYVAPDDAKRAAEEIARKRIYEASVLLRT